MSTLLPPVGFAVIGFGHIGKKHVENILLNSNARLVGIFDSDQQKQEEIKTKYACSFANLAELLNHPDVQIVCICTPNGLHFRHALESLNQNKHVIIEKPMTLSTSDATEIIETAQKVNKHVFCVMQNRYSPVAAWLKEVINENILGEIYSISVLCAWNRDERYYKPNHWHGNLELDGGPLFTQFSHFIDLIYWLLGKIDVNHSEFYNFNHQHLTQFEDSGFFTFTSPNFEKLKGLFQYTTAVFETNFESSIHIIAEKGTIKVGGQYMNEVQYCQIINYKLPSLDPAPPPNLYDGYQGSASNHHFVIQNAIESIQGKTSPKTSGNEGKDVVNIIETVYQKRIL
jgi:predicted dehydrogenase